MNLNILQNKKAIVGILIFLVLSVIVYLFVTDKFSTKLQTNETQIWANRTNIDPITWKIQQKTLSLDDYLVEISNQLNSWFADNYAKITKTEIVSLNDGSWKSTLKDNFYLVRFDVGPTDDTEKIGEFFKMMIDKRNKESGNIDVDEAMKKFKASKNYDAIIEQIKVNLNAVYWWIMSKWFYMIVEDRNWIYIVNRVWDYLNENYRSSLKVEDKDWLLVFRLLVDFLNYGRIYKANDSEVQTLIWISNNSLKRANILETLVKNANNNSSFSDFKNFLNKIQDKYQ